MNNELLLASLSVGVLGGVVKSETLLSATSPHLSKTSFLVP